MTALSGACAALSNISQYMNVVLGNLTAQPADCSYTSQCSSVQCSLGMTTDALTFALQPCNLPPSVAAVVKSVNDAEVMFNGTITNQQSFLWSLFSQDASVTISLYHYNSSVIGLEVKSTSDISSYNANDNFDIILFLLLVLLPTLVTDDLVP